MTEDTFGRGGQPSWPYYWAQNMPRKLIDIGGGEVRLITVSRTNVPSEQLDKLALTY